MTSQTPQISDVSDLRWMSSRRGHRPRTSLGTPHQQLEQNAPAVLQDELWARMQTLPHVRPGRSVIAGNVRALHLERSFANGPAEAFAPDGGIEFAHLHGAHDGSLHITLPPATAEAAIAAGWAEFHPVVLAGLTATSLVMIYGPRDPDELEVVFRFVQLSHAYATGSTNRATFGQRT